MEMVLVTFKVLLAELAGVGLLTGLLYLYWEGITKKN